VNVGFVIVFPNYLKLATYSKGFTDYFYGSCLHAGLPTKVTGLKSCLTNINGNVYVFLLAKHMG